MKYLPDFSGKDSILEFYKNDELIANMNNLPNAYSKDDGAYFKIGIYKWWWKSRPSNVNERTIFFDNVNISEILFNEIP